MSAEGMYVIMFLCVFMSMSAGALFGLCVERSAWKNRVIDRKNPNGGAHRCDGVLYYVVEESVFIHEYQRKPILPPQGGCGTAPAERTSK